MNTVALSLVVFYAVLYLLALALAIWKRKSFPLAETMTVTLILGVGFTVLVYLIVPATARAIAPSNGQTGELVFTVAYLFFATALLIRGAPVPPGWKNNFFMRKLAVLAFKLLLFVLIPLSAERLLWHTGRDQLGFSAGDISAQALPAAALILILGGFNLFAGKAAEPIRKRQFSAGQVAAGFFSACLWNLLEVGLVEEFFFRAFLQGRLIGFLDSPLAGICAASLLFGLAHAPGIYLRRGDEHGTLGAQPTLLNAILYAILGLSPMGWFTGLLYVRTQSLLVPIVLHAAIDAVAHTAEFIKGLGMGKAVAAQETPATPH